MLMSSYSTCIIKCILGRENKYLKKLGYNFISGFSIDLNHS